MPQLSVVLPVYNAEHDVAEALESVLGQTYADFEVLVLNDGSTDASRAIVARYADADPRIRVIERGRRGLVVTLNDGLAEARAEYVARMDADDIAMPQRLARQVEWLDRHPACVVVGSSFILVDERGGRLRVHRCFVNDLTIRHALAAEGCIPHPTAMFRRRAALGVGGYSAAYDVTEDYDLWRRLARVGELHNLPEPLLYKREASAAVSAVRADTQREQAARIRDEVWRDPDLSRYRRVSLRTLCRLPGEHVPALEELQKELALAAWRRRDVGSFLYLCGDLVRFRLQTPAARARA
jgi:glycosyltransferase involved in cell wall biosynthesis